MLPTEKCSNRCELEVGLSHISLLHKIALFLLHVRGMDEPQGAALSGSRREAGCLGTGVGGGEQDCARSHEAGTGGTGRGKAASAHGHAQRNTLVDEGSLSFFLPRVR